MSISYSPSTINAISAVASTLVGREEEVTSGQIVGDWSNDPSVIASKRFVLSRKPCICTECIREDGYIKSKWQYTINSFCEKHSVAHINVCSECKRELVWNVDLLNLSCQRCHADLKSPVKQFLPPHIKTLNSLGGEEKWKFTSRLREMVHLFMRPFDLMDKRITENPIMTRDWNELYTQITQHIESGKYPPSAYELLRDNTSSSEYREYIQSPLAAALHQVIKRAPSSEECRYFMDNEALKKWFGLEPYHMQACVEMKYSKVLFRKAYCGSDIYDYRDWHKMFSCFRKLNDIGTEISEVEREAPVFWCHEEEVVVGILRGKIPVRFKDPSLPNFKEAWVDRKAAHYYLRKQRTLLNVPKVTNKQARLALGDDLNLYRTLVRNNMLEKFKTAGRDSMVDIDSLKHIVENNLIPSREKIQNAFPSFPT